jgi:hypothetical protein
MHNAKRHNFIKDPLGFLGFVKQTLKPGTGVAEPTSPRNEKQG